MYGTVINARNVNEALPLGLSLVKEQGVPVVSRGMETLEVPGPVMTVYERPWENVLMCPTRDANPFFHFFEAMWILSGSDTVHLPKFFLNRITDYSDDGHRFHGAYGHRLRNWIPTSPTRGVIDQLRVIVELLRSKPDTRQAVASIWSPERDLGAATKDIPCNDMLMFKVRDDELNLTVCNRSNDVIWGAYGANAVQFSIIQSWVAAAVGVGVGRYTQMSDSYHVYTDLPLWKAYEAGEYRPDGHVVDPYRDISVKGLFLNTIDAEMFIKDCETLNRLAEHGLMEKALHRDALRSHAGVSVALPMLVAYLNYKQEQWGPALAAVDHITRPDWRTACGAWIKRRAAKKGVAL